MASLVYEQEKKNYDFSFLLVFFIFCACFIFWYLISLRHHRYNFISYCAKSLCKTINSIAWIIYFFPNFSLNTQHILYILTKTSVSSGVILWILRQTFTESKKLFSFASKHKCAPMHSNREDITKMIAPTPLLTSSEGLTHTYTRIKI